MTFGAGPLLVFGFATGRTGGLSSSSSPPFAGLAFLAGAALAFVVVVRAFLAGAAPVAEVSPLRFLDEAAAVVVVALVAAPFLTGTALAVAAFCFFVVVPVALVVALRFLEVFAASAASATRAASG